MVKALLKAIVGTVFVLVFGSIASAQPPSLDDFSRLSRSIGHRILLVDRAGVVREGILAAASADGINLRIGSETEFFARADIASAERLKDPTSDGVAKGVLFGAISGLGSQGYTSEQSAFRQWAGGVVGFGVIGFLLDLADNNRETIFRAAATSLYTAVSPHSRSVGFRILF